MKTRNRYFNPNPMKHDTGDCVVRSMCKALDKDWDTTYRELVEIGFELKVMPSNDKAWQELLKRNGFIQHKVSNKKGSKRPTVNGFAKDNNDGTFVLRVANHIVTCADGHYYDLWDCGSSSLYGYWEKPKQ